MAAGTVEHVLQLLLRPRWLGIVALFAAAVVAFVLLGMWQWDRGHVTVQNQPPNVGSARPASLDDVLLPAQALPADAVGTPVVIEGRFDASRQVLVPDRVEDGVTGFWVVTAFVAGQAATIPVVRGWAAPELTRIPEPPEEAITITGTLEASESESLRSGAFNSLPDGQLEIVNSAELLSLWRPPMYQGFVVQSANEVDAPLEVVTPASSRSKQTVWHWQNLVYGVQWWLFAIFAIFWLVRIVRVERDDQRAKIDALQQGPVQ